MNAIPLRKDTTSGATEPLGFRLMQISFQREREEHADNMLRAGRYFLKPQVNRRPLAYLGGAVLFGGLAGICFELYRRFALAPYFGIENLPPVQIVLLELAPVVAIVVAGIFLQRFLANKERRKLLIARLADDVMIDIDVHENGMVISKDGEATSYDWSAFQKIEAAKSVLVFYQDDRLIFIPSRAFKDTKSFKAQAEEIMELWKEAWRERMSGANQD